MNLNYIMRNPRLNKSKEKMILTKIRKISKKMMIKRSKKTIKMIMLTNSMMISTTKVLINLLKLLKIIVLNKRLPSRKPLNKDSSLLSNLRRLSVIGRLKRSNSTT